MTPGRIIILNGTSGSGKSSLSVEMQKQLDEPFWHVSSDQLISAKILPKRDFEGGKFNWKIMRPNFFQAFHNCIPAIAETGNSIILDHIIEKEEWLHQLQILLSGFDVLFIGLHCNIHELETRELSRVNSSPGLKRFIGESKEHLNTHNFCNYDFEINTSITPISTNAKLTIEAWKQRKATSLFFRRI